MLERSLPRLFKKKKGPRFQRKDVCKMLVGNNGESNRQVIIRKLVANYT